MKKWMGLFALLVMLPVVGANSRVINMPDGECKMKGQVTINVSFNQKTESFSAAKTMFDDRMKKIEEFAKQQKVKLTLQSQNFNISSNHEYNDGDGFSYQMSGSMAYLLEDTDVGLKFAEFLSKQKWQVNLSTNSYRQGGINCTQEDVGE